MSGIDNTTKRMQEDADEPLLLLGEAMITGSPESFIERQERDGQRQLVSSDRLPSAYRGDRAEWEALGFTFGDPDPDDPLFMPVTLPEGWKREGSDHAMWSYIADQHGRRRVGIFYKAAFYDRKADMHLRTLSSYASDYADGDAPLVFDDWATREGMLDALREHAEMWNGYAASAGQRGDRKGAEEDRAYAAKYEAAIAALEATA